MLTQATIMLVSLITVLITLITLTITQMTVLITLMAVLITLMAVLITLMTFVTTEVVSEVQSIQTLAEWQYLRERAHVTVACDGMLIGVMEYRLV